MEMDEELTKEEVVLCHLAVADLFLERFGSVVDVGVDPGVRQKLLHLTGVLILTRHGTHQ